MAGQPDTEADAGDQLRLKDIHAASRSRLRCSQVKMPAAGSRYQTYVFSILSLGKYSFILKGIPLLSGALLYL